VWAGGPLDGGAGWRLLPAWYPEGRAAASWTLGADAMTRLGIAESEWQSPKFNLLRKLGFTLVPDSETIAGEPPIQRNLDAVISKIDAIQSTK